MKTMMLADFLALAKSLPKNVALWALLATGICLVAGNATPIILLTGFPMSHMVLMPMLLRDQRRDWVAFRQALPLSRANVVAGRYASIAIVVAGCVGPGGRAGAALRLGAVSSPQGTVFLAGFIGRVERARWAMDAQITASTESEGPSLSLLEGMSFGLPAVVSDIGGNPLLIQDGENGLVFPNRDSRALAGCVARLMDDPALLRRLGEGAKRSFEENYTGEIFAKHVEDVYRDVLKGVSHGTK